MSEEIDWRKGVSEGGREEGEREEKEVGGGSEILYKKVDFWYIREIWNVFKSSKILSQRALEEKKYLKKVWN